jgi:YVTN family beta-propeller protein
MDIRRRVGTRRAVRLIVAVIGVACVGSGSREWTRAVGAAASASAVGQVDDGVARLKGTVWVVNRDRGELAIFDVDTGNVLATRPVGAGAHDICISEQAGKAYITAETIGIVTTVDLETLAMESIPVGPLPHHLEPSHDGRTIYVSLASHTAAVGTPQYAAIDTETNRVSYGPTSASAAARSHGPHPSLDGETLYVAHDIGDRVSAVDLLTGAISFEIPSIARAEEAIATRFGDLLWVSSRGDDSVKRIDLATNTITDSIRVGVQPESVMLTPSERTLIVSLRGTPATLAFVDTQALAFDGSVRIGPANAFGDLAVITKNGHHVFATFDAGIGGTGGVAVVDVHKREVVATWAYPGLGRPHGVWHTRRTPRP